MMVVMCRYCNKMKVRLDEDELVVSDNHQDAEVNWLYLAYLQDGSSRHFCLAWCWIIGKVLHKSVHFMRLYVKARLCYDHLCSWHVFENLLVVCLGIVDDSTIEACVWMQPAAVAWCRTGS